MTESNEGNRFGEIVQKFDPQSKLIRTWDLKGGVSAQVTALEIERPDGLTKKMIVRQHGAVDLKRNPHVAADEFKLLQILKSVGAPTPTPYHFDESGQIFSTPYIIIEFIEGQTQFTPSNLTDFILQLAINLIKIHSIDCSKQDLSFLPKQDEIVVEKLGKRPENLDESLDEDLIRDALESCWPLPQGNKEVLLHGDFWPGNVLWEEGQLVAVIDWEDAALGDPLADFANSRLEILWAFGIEAMNDFTHQYKSMMPTIDFSNLPHWDLYAALRPASNLSEWGLDESTEKRMRERHKWFISQAFEKISIQ
jgi:aminoglycoside phosphotransferase (APT) family kinase protein